MAAGEEVFFCGDFDFLDGVLSEICIMVSSVSHVHTLVITEECTPGCRTHASFCFVVVAPETGSTGDT